MNTTDGVKIYFEVKTLLFNPKTSENQMYQLDSLN